MVQIKMALNLSFTQILKQRMQLTEPQSQNTVVAPSKAEVM